MNQNPNAYEGFEPAILTGMSLWLSKNAIGAELTGGEFEITLYEDDVPVEIGTNDASGLIQIQLPEREVGTYSMELAETDAPQEWESDATRFPVVITYFMQLGALAAAAEYPEGLPGFINTLEPENGPCGLIEFPELTFDEPGTYEYVMRETTPSGDGWIADATEYRVVVTVINDGSGNLVASAAYPDGYPEFVNNYVLVPARIILSATKTTIGAPIECGIFHFGLFDLEGNLVAEASNGPAA